MHLNSHISCSMLMRIRKKDHLSSSTWWVLTKYRPPLHGLSQKVATTKHGVSFFANSTLSCILQLGVAGGTGKRQTLLEKDSSCFLVKFPLNVKRHIQLKFNKSGTSRALG